MPLCDGLKQLGSVSNVTVTQRGVCVTTAVKKKAGQGRLRLTRTDSAPSRAARPWASGYMFYPHLPQQENDTRWGAEQTGGFAAESDRGMFPGWITPPLPLPSGVPG